MKRARVILIVMDSVGIGGALLQAALWPHIGLAGHALACVLVAAAVVFVTQALGRWPQRPLERTLWLWLAGQAGGLGRGVCVVG